MNAARVRFRLRDYVDGDPNFYSALQELWERCNRQAAREGYSKLQ